LQSKSWSLISQVDSEYRSRLVLSCNVSHDGLQSESWNLRSQVDSEYRSRLVLRSQANEEKP
jgi:hypothetical protein